MANFSCQVYLIKLYIFLYNKSGPNDFHYDEKENKWKSVIGDLEEIIPKEIKELYSIDIQNIV